MKRWLVLLFLGASSFAKPPWPMPKERLTLGFEAQYYRSSENFDREGERFELFYLGQQAKLTEWRFLISPSYALTSDWAVQLQIPVLFTSVAQDTATDLSTSSAGLGDIRLGLVYQLAENHPALALETYFQVPAYSTSVIGNDEIVLGDGSFDVGLLLHAGFASEPFFGSLSPGVVWRTNHYSSRFLLDLNAGARWQEFYFQLGGELSLSFEEQVYYNSNEFLTRPDALGAAGSYSRLSESPSSLMLKAGFGVPVSPSDAFELNLATRVWGNRAPKDFLVGLKFVGHFDFYEEKKLKPLKIIPLNS